MAWWSRTGKPRPDRGVRTSDLDLDELIALNAAGVAHWEADRSEAAIIAFENALTGCRTALGQDHPDTLTVEGNLAVCYVCAGRWGPGLDLMAENFDDRIRVLGNDHTHTLDAGESLASGYRLAGRTEDAASLSAEIAARRSAVLGPSHPDTLTSRMGVALARAAAADLEGAVALLTEALRDAERVGSSPRHTIALRANVAVCEALRGREREAIPIFERAVSEAVALFGPRHPDTLAIYEDLANVYRPDRLAPELRPS